MGLFGQLLSSVTGNAGGTMNEIAALEGVVAVIHHPSVGGVEGLATKFQAAGLGHVAQGWIGNGTNPPVSAAQLQQVLGSAPIAEFAQKLGISPDQAVAHLTQMLPHVIDQLCPNGQAPAGGTASAEVLNLLKAKLLSH